MHKFRPVLLAVLVSQIFQCSGSSQESTPTTDCVASKVCEPKATSQEWENPSRGTVTVGTPKIWRFDHVFSTIDGMLRDVDAVTLQALAALDPNAPNQSAMDVLVQTFRIAGGFNSAIGASNALNLDQARSLSALQTQQTQDLAATLSQNNRNLAALQARQFQTYTTLQNQILARQTDLSAQLFALQDQRLKLPADDKAAATSLDAQITSIQAQLKALADSGGATLQGIKDLQSAQATTPTPPSAVPLLPAGTTGTNLILTPGAAPSSSMVNIGADDAKNLAALADTVGKALQSAQFSLPATKRMDNFITLLHERLSRELAVNIDDASVQRSLYLVQFDVGVFPFPKAKDQILRVAIDITKKGAKAYDLYPGQSAYNINRFFGRSTRTGIAGAFQFLSGLGLTAEYQRQRDQARGSLTQSVYIAGIGAGTGKFGWYFGPAPEDDTLTPGTRQVYALLSLPPPKSSQVAGRSKPPEQGFEDVDNIDALVSVTWIDRKHGKSIPGGAAKQDRVSMSLPIADAQPKSLKIERVAYKTVYTKDHFDPDKEKEDCGSAIPPEFASVEILTHDPLDPDLKLSVNGFLLPRLRDFKGRATAAVRSALGPTGAAFGLTEVDTLSCSHWIALSPRSILLRLSRARAKEEVFPQIRFLTDSSKDGDAATIGLVAAANELGTSAVGDEGTSSSRGLFINGQRIHLLAPLRAAAYPPLFSVIGNLDTPKSGDDAPQGAASVQAYWLPPSPRKKSVRAVALTLKPLLKGRPPLDESTYVTYVTASANGKPSLIHALSCQHNLDALICDVPYGDGRDLQPEFSLSVERPSRGGQDGFAATDIAIAEKPREDPVSINGLWKSLSATPQRRDFQISVKSENWSGGANLLADGERIDGLKNCTKNLCGEIVGTGPDRAVRLSLRGEWPTLAETLQKKIRIDFPVLKKQVDLPSLDDVAFPRTADATTTASGFVLRGVNFSTVQGVALRGATNSACANQLLLITAGLGDRIVTFNVIKELTPGTYAVAFWMGGDRCEKTSYIDALDAKGNPLFVEFRREEKKETPKTETPPSGACVDDCRKTGSCCGAPAVVQYFTQESPKRASAAHSVPQAPREQPIPPQPGGVTPHPAPPPSGGRVQQPTSPSGDLGGAVVPRIQSAPTDREEAGKKEVPKDLKLSPVQ